MGPIFEKGERRIQVGGHSKLLLFGESPAGGKRRGMFPSPPVPRWPTRRESAIKQGGRVRVEAGEGEEEEEEEKGGGEEQHN